MIRIWMCKEMSWPNVRYSSRICRHWLSKIMINLQNGRCPARHSTWTTPTHKSTACKQQVYLSTWQVRHLIPAMPVTYQLQVRVSNRQWTKLISVFIQLKVADYKNHCWYQTNESAARSQCPRHYMTTKLHVLTIRALPLLLWTLKQSPRTAAHTTFSQNAFLATFHATFIYCW